MVNEKEMATGVEWRIRVDDGSSERLAPKSGPVIKAWLVLQGVILDAVEKISRFFKLAWDIGVDDPRKFVHCLKVGMALTIVSLFYYMRPLYDGVGGNAVWAIMTVVVVFENSAGATISKSLNRICATILAAFLAVGVNWIADQSGKIFEPIVLGASVFLFASAATFSRFIPKVKARFDYGAMIFILTFSLVSVSGYRVDELFSFAHDRVSTVIIGTFLCILVTLLICPIWAGEELHKTITRNMEKLANALECSVTEFFNDSGRLCSGDEEFRKKLIGYKCVLSSKATEDSMANFAWWEPAHGHFNFRHPWKHYLEIGTSMRSCAYCIDALHSCIATQNQASESTKKHIAHICLRVGSNSSKVLRELNESIKAMRKSSNIDILVGKMNSAMEELQDELKSLPSVVLQQNTETENPESKKMEEGSRQPTISLLDIMPIITSASLLIETVERINGLVEAVEELANVAEFQHDAHVKVEQNQTTTKVVSDEEEKSETMMALQRV